MRETKGELRETPGHASVYCSLKRLRILSFFYTDTGMLLLPVGLQLRSRGSSVISGIGGLAQNNA